MTDSQEDPTGFLGRIDAFKALGALKTKYRAYSSGIKVASQLGVFVESGQLPVVFAAKNGFPEQGSIEKFQDALRYVVGLAANEKDEKLAYLNEVTLVACCSMLEEGVKDYVALLIQKNPERWDVSDRVKVDVVIAEFLAQDSLGQTRLLIDQAFSKYSGTAFSRLKLLLSKVKVELKDQDLKGRPLYEQLEELFEIRNSIVHRGSRTDLRLQRSGNRFAGNKIGDRIAIDEKDSIAYLDAADKFADNILLQEI